jgi:hypothetical protein
MRRPAFALLLASGAICLSACSVSITANDDSAGEESGAAVASQEAAPNASEQAGIDQEFYDFCTTEATNNVDFISGLGDLASPMITDGMTQSIAQQQLTGVQAESCKQAWIDVMAAAGVVYVDPAGGSSSQPSAGTSPSASPAPSAEASAS